MTKRIKESERKIRNYGGLSVEEPRLYNIWCGMIHRCENPNRSGFEKYGAKGITVCDEWHSFETFVEWAKANGYKDGLTIDRINNNGGYNPMNCRWADAKTQANNKGSNVVIAVGGIEGTLKQWADLIGVNEYTLYDFSRRHGKNAIAKRIESAIRIGKFEKYPEVERVCVRCGVTFISPSTANAKYCEPCREIAKREKYRRYRERKRNCGARVIGTEVGE